MRLRSAPCGSGPRRAAVAPYGTCREQSESGRADAHPAEDVRRAAGVLVGFAGRPGLLAVLALCLN
ncbi:hypothetical protein DVA86_15465 [Streptomyces armeniacus]|uniref:Uncharacterized protein n=1 Tax=Streptomyces armeniacus TaxID=83291 RepID=A0A345XQD4_9ACTN|nr:hypothetical protein DVA86_15465 [Streptomyces armeniacus]